MAATSCCWCPALLPSSHLRQGAVGSEERLQEVRRVPQCFRGRLPCLAVRHRRRAGFVVRSSVDQEPKTKEEAKERVTDDADIVTQKYGLEAGLWQIFKNKDGENTKGGEGKSRGQQAKDLLAKYGVAYLGTSISLSLVSITVCYLLINAGVDVSTLLEKVGIHANGQGEQVGTFALAYAAHKALSPIRFPPTVALTPLIANFIGKKPAESGEK